MVATSKFGLLTTRRHSATRKHLFLYPQGDRSGLKKSKKGKSTLITATTSIHLPEPVSTDLTIKLDSVLTNPIGNGLQDQVTTKLKSLLADCKGQVQITFAAMFLFFLYLHPYSELTSG